MSKDSLSYEISDIRLLIDCGMLLIMRRGWFDFFVDVEWNVVRLVEWHVCSIRQIEGHIKEVYDFFVGFDCDFVRPCLPKILQRSFLICSA